MMKSGSAVSGIIGHALEHQAFGKRKQLPGFDRIGRWNTGLAIHFDDIIGSNQSFV